ncbi:uncharacterized protein LOC113237386 [Hyposmocoma kahamanoa]|uniref:uncharacterized protein LOC113237386 n=1 Tax=Hyposmocoma kahamanoa TaxID=1477025 RepID=UPI000E6D7EBC|nr:uncharacterized protein LOC113237386 [Hyposmocoma kahamanoa]
MAFKGIFIVALVACCVQIAVAFPKNNFIVNTEEIVKVTDRTEEKLRTEQITEHGAESPEPVSVHHPYQVVHCEFEEVTEDIVCREPCLRKGYSYGLCVGRRCSCV